MVTHLDGDELPVLTCQSEYCRHHRATSLWRPEARIQDTMMEKMLIQAHDISSILTDRGEQGDWVSGNNHIRSHTNWSPKHSSQNKERTLVLGRKTLEQGSSLKDIRYQLGLGELKE